MNGCAYTDDDVVRFHLGEMDAADDAAFREHFGYCARCAAAVAAQQRLDRAIPSLPHYRPPRLDQPRVRTAPQRLLIAAALTAIAAGGLFLRQDQRTAEEDRLVHAALTADARMLAFLPGRTAPAPEHQAVPPWLGFVMCDDWIANDSEGLYICALAPDGPLGRAGVEAGEVLLAIDGRGVPSDTAMHRRLARHAAGDVVEVRIRRQGGEVERLRVRLEARRIGERHPFDMTWSPALTASLTRTAPGAADLNDVFQPASADASGGLRVLMEPAPEQLRRTVLSPLPHLFGEDRLLEGDIITAVEEEPVAGLWDLLPALMRVQDRTRFQVHVLRAGAPLAITIQNPKGTRR